MKKFFTTLCCMAAMAAFALPASAADYTLNQSVTFNGSGQCTFCGELEDQNATTPFSIVSNVSTDLSAYIQFGRDLSSMNMGFIPLDFKTVVTSNGNYAYNFEGGMASEDKPGGINLSTSNVYTFIYSGSETVTFTFKEGYATEDEPNEGPDENGYYTFGQSVTFGADLTSVSFDTKDQAGYLTLVTNNSTNVANLFSVTKNSGSTVFDLNPVQTPDGFAYEVYFFGSAMYFNDDSQMDIAYTGSDEITVLLKQGLANDSGSSDGQTIELDVPFTLSSSAPTASFYLSDDPWAYQEVYLLTNSAINLKEEGLLQIKVYGADMFGDQYNWEPVFDEEKQIYAYNDVVSGDMTYEFIYSGTEPIEFTLKPGSYTSEGAAQYMDYYAMVVEPVSGEYAVELNEIVLSWAGAEKLTDTASGGKIRLYVDGEDQTSKFLEWSLIDLNSLNGDAAEGNDASESVLNGMLINFNGLAQDASGNPVPGRYLVEMPAGLVADQDGLLNIEQYISITILPTATYTVSPEPNKEYDSVETVTITFDGEIEENSSWEGASGVTVNGNRGAVSFEGAVLTINLNATESGEYNIVVPAAFFLIDEESLNPEIELTFTVGTTDSVSTLVNEKGELNIYNLQGVRVANPQKGQIYILNGKKTVLR